MQGDRDITIVYTETKKNGMNCIIIKIKSTHTDMHYTQEGWEEERREREREEREGGRGRERDFASKCQIIILRKLNSLLSSMTDFGYGRTF